MFHICMLDVGAEVIYLLFISFLVILSDFQVRCGRRGTEWIAGRTVVGGGQAWAAAAYTVDERKEETSILEGNTQQFKTLII